MDASLLLMGQEEIILLCVHRGMEGWKVSYIALLPNGILTGTHTP